jgi:hypothetical protein
MQKLDPNVLPQAAYSFSVELRGAGLRLLLATPHKTLRAAEGCEKYGIKGIHQQYQNLGSLINIAKREKA